MEITETELKRILNIARPLEKPFLLTIVNQPKTSLGYDEMEHKIYQSVYKIGACITVIAEWYHPLTGKRFGILENGREIIDLYEPDYRGW